MLDAYHEETVGRCRAFMPSLQESTRKRSYPLRAGLADCAVPSLVKEEKSAAVGQNIAGQKIREKKVMERKVLPQLPLVGLARNVSACCTS